MPTAPVLGLARPALPESPVDAAPINTVARESAVPRPVPRPASRARRRGALVALFSASAALAGLGGAAIFRERPSAAVESPAPATDPAAPPAAVLSENVAPQPPSSLSAPPPGKLPSPPSRAAPAHRGPAARASCTPAYTTDAMGMRHYKPECLK